MITDIAGFAYDCINADALACGAKKSEIQYFETSTVMFDPEGHPFCFSTVKQ